MASYAATISCSSISSDSRSLSNKSAVKKGGVPLSTDKAVDLAKGHLQYILNAKKTDPEQHGDVIHCHQGNCKTIDKKSRPKFAQAMNDAVVKRVLPTAETLRQKRKKGVPKYSFDLLKKSVRVMDKIIVSLPNDASLEQQKEIGSKILQDLCGDSQAHGICAIHGDAHGKNNHLHIALIDGLESLETAKKRAAERTKTTGKKTRVRQKYHLNFNDIGSRKIIREKIGSIINEIADRDGLTNAEIRSLKDQGIAREPQIHEGPKGSLAWRGGKSSDHTFSNMTHNMDLLAKERFPKDPFTEIPLSVFPARMARFTDPALRKVNKVRKKKQLEKLASENAQRSAERVSKALTVHHQYHQLSNSKRRIDRVHAAVWRHNDIVRRVDATQSIDREKPFTKLVKIARANYTAKILYYRKFIPELKGGPVPWKQIQAAIAARIFADETRSNGSTAKDRQVSTEQTIHGRQRRPKGFERD